MAKSNRPSQYIVYTDMPSYGYGSGCHVRVLRVPKTMSRESAYDLLPPTVGKLAWVSAYSASTAKEHAMQSRGVVCPRNLGRSRRKRRR
jgi:hypothetical protein